MTMSDSSPPSDVNNSVYPGSNAGRVFFDCETRIMGHDPSISNLVLMSPLVRRRLMDSEANENLAVRSLRCLVADWLLERESAVFLFFLLLLLLCVLRLLALVISFLE